MSKGDQKNNVEVPGVLVLGVAISKASNTILWNFLGWSFLLSEISRGKVETFQEFFKKVYPKSALFFCFLFLE